MADFRLLWKSHGLLKLAEIILAITAIILVRVYSLNFGGELMDGTFQDRYNVGLVTVGGFILITLPLLISYLWSPTGTYQPFLEIIYNFVGFVLFITVGALALHHYTNYNSWKDHTSMAHYYNHYGPMNRDHELIRGDTTTHSWEDGIGTNHHVDQYGNPHGGNYDNYGSGLNRYDNTTNYIAAGKAMGSICIINGFFYFIDTVIALKQGTNSV